MYFTQFCSSRDVGRETSDSTAKAFFMGELRYQKSHQMLPYMIRGRNKVTWLEKT